GQRVAVDAGQTVLAQRMLLVVVQIEQQQLLALRELAADAGAHVLDLVVAAFGDVLGHLAALAFVVFRFAGDQQQPATVRRQRAAADAELVAEVERRRCAAAVGRLFGIGALAFGLAVGALVGEHAEQAQLVLAQRVGFGRFGRVLL